MADVSRVEDVGSDGAKRDPAEPRKRTMFKGMIALVDRSVGVVEVEEADGLRSS